MIHRSFLTIFYRPVYFIIIIILFSTALFFQFFSPSHSPFLTTDSSLKFHSVDFTYDNVFFSNISTDASTIEDFFQRSAVTISEKDIVYPGRTVPIHSGMHIILKRARKITVHIDGKDQLFFTHEETPATALMSEKIILHELDILSQKRNSFLYHNTDLTITRVIIKDETKQKKIKYDTKNITDDTLSWRKKIVTQKGEFGLQEIIYQVAYHDGKEVRRAIISDTITKKPTTEIITQGTYIELGKKHTGLGSWYAHTGTMAAANPWLPFGSYVKVTNTANGKSVIVKINDRGPFGPNRIIDLDKVAFEKLASLGTGIISVTMEEIKN